jgi:hypothetical protein
MIVHECDLAIVIAAQSRCTTNLVLDHYKCPVTWGNMTLGPST